MTPEETAAPADDTQAEQAVDATRGETTVTTPVDEAGNVATAETQTASAAAEPVINTETASADVAAEATAPEVNSIHEKIEAAIASKSPTMRALGVVFKKYHTLMGMTKGTDRADVLEQNTQLWLVLKAAVNDTNTFRDCMNFIMEVFRNNEDGAFELRGLLREVDAHGTRLNASHRAGYRGLVTLLSTAAQLNNPKDVRRTVDVVKAVESEVFNDDARQRIIGYFAG